MHPIRPQPRLAAAPSMSLPHHAAIQQQLNQIKVNQCLSAARNVLSNMGPMVANPVSPLAVQMAMAQQLGGNPFLGQFQMPFPVAPNHQLMMQHFASLQQQPPPPNNHPMANLYVKRMNEETAVKDESSPPIKRRRSRKPNQVNRCPVEEPQKISPKLVSRPDQFVMQDGQGRGPIIFRGVATPAAVVTSHHQQVPVIHHQPYPQQVQFNHQMTAAAPVYFPPVAAVPIEPVGSPAPSTASSSGASQPPVSTSPLAQSLSPPAVFTNGVRVSVTSTVDQTPASQNFGSVSPIGQPERISPVAKVNGSPDSGSFKTPPKEEQQLKVPPLKIRLSDINQSPEGKKCTPPRAGLPAIVQKSSLYAKGDRVQQQITAYRAEETDAKDEFSLKNLLDNSPPAAKVPESVVSKFDDNVYYKNDCSVSH
jgi:hypothetical protein